MSFKQTLIIIVVIVILMIGLYYLMSPLQNCLRFPLECAYLPDLLK
jgi:cytochrome c oxidase assembly protein Cox11